MNRQIGWDSCVLDEIELVYEKAQADGSIGQLLEKLETQALGEVRRFTECNGEPPTDAQFAELGAEFKENAIVQLASWGREKLDTDIAGATIVVRFTPKLPLVQACVFFDLLNRLEKLDGALNILHPKWTLELQAPLGGKKGLMQWEMLIMMLYPWLSVREISTEEVAIG